MTTHALSPVSWRGAWLILRFNWPRYAAAAIVLCVVFALILWAPLRPQMAWLAFAAAAPAVFWTLASLLVSHAVYDRSAASDWRVLRAALATPPRRWLNIHAGLDNGGAHLRRLWPTAQGLTLDIYDPIEMTEPSIRRARRASPPSISVDYRRLPLPDASRDAVLLLFAAHELRTHDARAALLRECRRVLTHDGTVVIAEHLRDGWGFLAFGPGVLHFHSAAAWRAAASDAGLSVECELQCTRFARVFVLRRQP